MQLEDPVKTNNGIPALQNRPAGKKSSNDLHLFDV